ncbi:MAG: bifunctional phosphoserine phosphatase/homoserine phosphotransferase ThrH [Nitrospiraceae bacterium]|jgi:phosphoserine/homoserine phosphotransferase|uniref:bifunctional phosphoserine phosphatase/homoserine phosphotransferase ThrH n=1 Tax=Nitrospira cf. moscoviensis SBR1015 TaxID=96242 RepID=UPI000A0A04F6|nr:bifunctional phosphoserine phosphatase/homoserine phosphotransferase ThrH [Nitrospira cf. moscoviensis SBR1015]MBY0248017.1 bifunctional phosphoserine phosphatase/homoserine phosphotransferase ThrH [Nitrospiraceae bacterium]OQW32569.1 MAG: phosphoserine phosphatase/homoserine phosphotransferase bifunctional protein [Nitrospira sp. SG-bin2]
MQKPVIVCLDLEGVLVPEIWINVALKTGIEELKITTREMPDYDKLMRQRLAILDRNNLKISDIQEVIGTMGPLEGAPEFIRWIHDRCQVIILSDTFYQFAFPLMKQLGFPTLFCNQLEIDAAGRIANYHMRMQNQKKHSVAAFKSLSFFTMAAGDAYNDTAMLGEADAGFFFRPPDHLPKEFPQFPVTHTYGELQERLGKAGNL